MTKPIEIWGCVQCYIEFKDEKETREHYDKFREKGDKSHVAIIVKMMGVAEKVEGLPEFTNVDSDSIKKN